MTFYFAAGLEYDGSNYSGWQKQAFLDNTVQFYVEKCLSQIANHQITVNTAGRTDAGVHALGQVISFQTESFRKNFSWLAGVNRYLPGDIRLQWIYPVDENFHARHSAYKRHYRYLILNQRQPSALWQKRALWHIYPLNINHLQKAANYLLGEHDFGAFRSSECQSKSAFRRIDEIIISKNQHIIQIDIIGNAFLHHMVRNIIGTLILIGEERKPPEWMQEVLLSKDRTKAGYTAAAHGLYFLKVHYKNYQFPSYSPNFAI